MRDSPNDADPVRTSGCRSKKIVLGQRSNQPIASDKQRERFDNRCLPGVVSTDESGELSEGNLA
jgi:hypothetical protein